MKASGNMHDDIVMKLAELAEGNETYAAFNKRIVNTDMPVVGVRVPDLRRLQFGESAHSMTSDITK